jgi:uncharacterized protein (DUF302 family)
MNEDSLTEKLTFHDMPDCDEFMQVFPGKAMGKTRLPKEMRRWKGLFRCTAAGGMGYYFRVWRTIMKGINFKREINGTIDDAIEPVTRALGAEGFGVLTRIDMHSKVKEKTGKEIIPTVILGACNPDLAYEAYTSNSDVASLLPCNAVIREVEPGRISMEFIKPTAMMEILGDAKLAELAQEADTRIERALRNA